MNLNLGCGPHALAGWRNLDAEPHPGVEPYDLSRGTLPASSGSVDFIFSEHFIEHITRDQAQALLRDCHRILKPDGVLRISTPDLAVLLWDYGRCALDRWAPTWQPKTRCQMVNEGMRLWGHQFLYDFAELRDLLESVGFPKLRITQAYWRESGHPALRELEIRPFHRDLIVEAVKQ